MPQQRLSAAIYSALRTWPLTGGSLALALTAVPAAAQNPAPADNAKSQNLETIVVTGSNIRRVDTETANPVVTIDKASIQSSGKLTLGDLLDRLPASAGGGSMMASNPQANNGGGTGATRITLRGLGSTRSLLLINGHRVSTPLQDLNMIPASAVERIEVLSDGSSAVYGSDAIAGVVNVITRNSYQGAEFGLDYGISDHDDAARRGAHGIFGQSTDKGSIVVGFNYNKNDPVLAANREFSHDALYKYSNGFVNHAGSSRTPNGSISLPGLLDDGTFAPGSLAAHYNCPNSGTRVTRIAGRSGASLDDYRCYSSADSYNYQAIGNYDLTPAERSGVFALGNYKLNDNVEAFIELFHNKTRANTHVAPLPLDALTDTFIPSTNYYNPFGIDFGTPKGGVPTNQFRSRYVALGDRINDFATTHDLVTAGLKGTFASGAWAWNVDFSYGHMSQNSKQYGYLNYSALRDALGPSFKDPSTGKIVCGTPDHPIGGCTPVDLFNLQDPSSVAALNLYRANPMTQVLYQTRTVEGGINGSLFELPAGTVSMAAGLSYRKEYRHQEVDSTIRSTVDDQFNIGCPVGFSICSAPAQGGYNIKEAYGELLVPILKDAPFARALNLNIGDRYSKYSEFGSTNNWKIAIEWRPIDDLLLRGTVSKVFRAPSVTDLYSSLSGDSPTASDPCGSAAVASNPLCQGYTFVNTATSQLNGVVAGSKYAHDNLGYQPQLKPENGKSYDFGFVYDAPWLPGLAISADYYKITLNNMIVSGPGTASTILNQCFNSPAASPSPLCSLVKRYNAGTNRGQISSIYEATFNLGNLVHRGADFSASYRLPETSWGNFRASFQATYIAEHTIDNNGVVQGYAGVYDRGLGNFARWRALTSLDWNLGAFSADWTMRYVGPFRVGYPAGGGPGSYPAGLGPSANVDGSYTNSPYFYGAWVYHNVSFAYHIEPIDTTVQIGIDNVGNKQPPILYQQNTVNANTDTASYDLIGRFYYAKITMKF